MAQSGLEEVQSHENRKHKRDNENGCNDYPEEDHVAHDAAVRLLLLLRDLNLGVIHVRVVR